MAQARMLPGFGVVTEQASQARMLPGAGVVMETAAAAAPAASAAPVTNAKHMMVHMPRGGM